MDPLGPMVATTVMVATALMMTLTTFKVLTFLTYRTFMMPLIHNVLIISATTIAAGAHQQSTIRILLSRRRLPIMGQFSIFFVFCLPLTVQGYLVDLVGPHLCQCGHVCAVCLMCAMIFFVAIHVYASLFGFLA